ncbi:hypothetical protein [Winogradskyella vidalii]|uniref:hypothetical protein n=1 Tax=Winogradskyella vidalii TaxID=2615024 RepID=UPI0015C9D677|nr:hypothetical protein [Winogradskyella vidalii]
MSNFKSDLQKETLLAAYLDAVYFRKNIDFKRVTNLSQQLQGIDLVIMHKADTYYIDEKAQLHYLNKNLPTFTFELSYLKKGQRKTGWLFDEQKLTHYYFLVTGIYLKGKKSKLKYSKDIERLKITSVNRGKLVKHLNSIGLTKEKLNTFDSILRKGNKYGKKYISELNPKSEGLLYYSKHLREKPINLQLRLSYLIENKIAKKFHYT